MQPTDFVPTFVLLVLAIGVPGCLTAEEAASEPATPAVSVAPEAAPGSDAASQPAAAAVAADVSVAAVAAPTVATVASTTVPGVGLTPGESGFSEADRIVVHKSKRRLELLKAGAVVAEYPIRLGLNPEGHKLLRG